MEFDWPVFQMSPKVLRDWSLMPAITEATEHSELLISVSGTYPSRVRCLKLAPLVAAEFATNESIT